MIFLILRLALSPINAKWFSHGIFLTIFFIYLSMLGLQVLFGYEDSDFSIRVVVGIIIAGINFMIIPFFYWYDKRAANAANAIRIPEIVLHVFAFLGGAISALICQRIFRHKTKKIKFRAITYLALLLNFLLAYTIFTKWSY